MLEDKLLRAADAFDSWLEFVLSQQVWGEASDPFYAMLSTLKRALQNECSASAFF